jgi:hypothetical protein
MADEADTKIANRILIAVSAWMVVVIALCFYVVHSG